MILGNLEGKEQCLTKANFEFSVTDCRRERDLAGSPTGSRPDCEIFVEKSSQDVEPLLRRTKELHPGGKRSKAS